MTRFLLALTAVAFLLFGSLAIGCDSNEAPATIDADGGADEGGTAATFALGGTVIGLVGTGLVVQSNAGGDLAVSANGSFVFPSRVERGTSFSVTIKTQPVGPSQTCTVAGGNGTVVTGDVTTVVVNCATNPTVGGTVTGLYGFGLVLQNNDGDDLAVNANTFAFPTPLAAGTTYSVTVKKQPSIPNQICTVANGAGTIVEDVTTVAITCTTVKYTVGGTVTGLTASGLVLQNRSGDDLAVSANATTLTFDTPQDDGTLYAVTLKSQPTGLTCTVMQGSGTVAGGNVTTVSVSCVITFTVGGTLTGLDYGMNLVLRLTTGTETEVLPVGVDGTFAFIPKVDGTLYTVTVENQPTIGGRLQWCTVSDGTGQILGANVTNVAVSCALRKFQVEGSVENLTEPGLVLKISGYVDEEVSIPSGATSFVFPTLIESGNSFTVAVKQMPAALRCVIASGSPGGAYDSPPLVKVTCAPWDYCVFVDGIWWCKDKQKGRGCNTFCSSLGLGNPKISDSAWLAAQDSVGECYAIATALGYATVVLKNYATSCAEMFDGEYTLYCSTYAACPAKHRDEGNPIMVSVCPCD